MFDHPEMDDRAVIELVGGGDKAALEVLHGRYSNQVYALAMYMLKQPSLAEETTQDVFLNIWQKAASYNGERGEPRTWIMSIAHHRIIDVLRARRRTALLTDPGGYETLEYLPSGDVSTEDVVTRNLERERIMRALDMLPEAQRQVIILAYFGGLSQSEIAEKLSQPLGTIKTRVRLALQKLRVILEEDVAE